jgi:adenylate cyclase class 2
MAFDNIEIEIKIKIDENQVEQAKLNLNKLGQLKNITEQIDTYFAPSSNNYLLEKFPFKWFSIRERNGKTILNYKHFFPEGAEQHSYCNEYETELSSKESMKAILNELNIFEVVEVNKVRETYIIGDNYEIVLDNVKGLGYYLEIEAMKDMGSPENVKSEMMQFISSIGITNYVVDHRGYPFELLKLSGKL